MAFIPAAESMFGNHEDCHLPTSSSCVPQDFHGVSQLIMRRSMSFSGMDHGAEEFQGDDDMSDDGSQLMIGEKKRRLNLEQVKALEKSFELGNKLEPERKMQLARALGLKPRQIAIWFQNRRARWKTKQLEKDYNILKKQFEAIKADNHALKSQNKKLHAQLLAVRNGESMGLGNVNLNKDNEGSWSNGSDNSCDVNLKTTSTDSTLYPHSNNKSSAVVFPSSNIGPSAASLTQLLLHSTSRPDHFQSQKIDHVPASNEGFCNMFGGIEETPDFWPWPEQQNFH